MEYLRVISPSLFFIVSALYFHSYMNSKKAGNIPGKDLGINPAEVEKNKSRALAIAVIYFSITVALGVSFLKLSKPLTR